MKYARSVLDTLAPLARHISSPGYDDAVDYLLGILPFDVHVYRREHEVNGWVLPPKWSVAKAEIRFNGSVIYDGTLHPLSVVSHSSPFSGAVSLDELREHLFFDRRFPSAIPYHFRYSYRPWQRDWGFCVSQQFYDALEEGEYTVLIETRESEPDLPVLDFVVNGGSGKEFVFVAHLDHPGAANDGLSGVAAGVELFHRLARMKLKNSYRLVLVQEIIGSQFYLHHQGICDTAQGLFLEMLSAKAPLCLQSSYRGDALMDIVVGRALDALSPGWEKSPFRCLVRNDEIVFEAFGVSMPSLARFPYPEYHCDGDNLDAVSYENLYQSVEVLLRVVEELEEEQYVRKTFDGMLCLSNPEVDLYIEPGQRAFTKAFDNFQMHELMDGMAALRSGAFLGELSEKYGIDRQVLRDYLRKWQEKGFVEML